MEIYNYFSKLGIYNCILVSQVHYVIDKGYNIPTKENYVETGVQLRVNTWFPYQSSQHCIEVDDITLLDSWVFSAQGHFTKNNHLFPIKISNSFKGCLIKTVVRTGHWTPNAHHNINKFPNGSVVRTAEGKNFDLLSVVLQHMNDISFGAYNSRFSNGQRICTKFNYDNDCKGSLYCFRWCGKTYFVGVICWLHKSL